MCWPIYRVSGIETVFLFSLVKPWHNEHGGMRGGAVHIQEIEKARNSSDYPASGMPPKQNKGAAQRRSTNIPTPRKRQKTIVPIGGMLFYLGGMFFFLLEVNFFPYLFFCLHEANLKPLVEAIARDNHREVPCLGL